MNIYISNFKTLRQELKTLLYFAVILIFLIEFILFDIPEIFPKANVLGNITLKFCYSYISALIFYFLVVHFKRQKEKRDYYKILNKNISTIINQGKNLEHNLKRFSEIEHFNSCEIDDLRKVLSKINPKELFQGVHYAGVGYVHWYKHLYYESQKSKTNIDLIFKNSILLEAELISLLNEIYQCLLFSQLELFSAIFESIGNENLESLSENFKDYFEKVSSLEKYKVKEIDKYLF